jgi:hypothetical protein
MNTEQMTKILLEVSNGKKPPTHESEDAAVVRAKLQAEVEAIRAKGGIVDVPRELP